MWGVEMLAPVVGRVQAGLGEQGSVWAPPGPEGAFVLWALGAPPPTRRGSIEEK